MTTTETIDGLTYSVRHMHDNMYDLTLIGRRGKPIKQSRLGKLRQDGTWWLGGWMRI